MAHVARLASLGGRLPGSEADVLARAYLARELSAAGAEVDAIEGGSGASHLVARLGGRSADRVLVMAPYGLLGEASRVDDAGVAVALDLVRAASARPRAYALVVAFAAVTPARAGGTGDPEWAVPATLDAARDRVAAGGADLVDSLRRTGEFEGVRAAIALEPRAAPDARIARDLRSHPVFRSVFWRVADDLGLAELFPPAIGWTEPEGLHAALHSAGFGSVLALIDDGRSISESAPGEGDAAPADAGVSGSRTAQWAGVGRVTDEGIVRLMRRFERVDAFAPAD